ncbi:hypothetical protein EGI22_02740 [Lacihabitans sp. LS3-19]|uniref:hypothetical protein n=1 Tax=Lacihabitans sp. LS3-19 TaxID=2487335 RepID=UPI0020CD7377|nr:hypothetical protein [Lacihabitans sp. LS3-19]MCP9766809.1 hypothetical protein [Lacihabitans sp. LS3-19]
MDLQTSKIELVKIILEIENQDLIKSLTSILINKEKDFWSELTEDEKTEIKHGINQLDSGLRIPFEDFIRKVS